VKLKQHTPIFKNRMHLIRFLYVIIQYTYIKKAVAFVALDKGGVITFAVGAQNLFKIIFTNVIIFQ